MVDKIADVLMKRDGMTLEEAQELIYEARTEANDRIWRGEDAYDICEEYFGLEPDYLEELIF
jgi:hypothetical protein